MAPHKLAITEMYVGKIEALNATVLPRAEKLAITEMYVGKIEALNATVLPRGTQKQNCV